jgi:beta-lactamase regulating signal transducer with metallopeptidase domain
MLGWFAETTLVASGLAVVAALASRLRPIGPTARHALWLVVLIKLMTPPLVSWPWAGHWGNVGGSLFSPTAAHAASMASNRKVPCPCPMVPALSSGRTTSATAPWRFAIHPSQSGIGVALRVPQRVVVDLDETDVVAVVSPRAEPVSVAEPAEATWLPRALVFAWLTLTVLLGLGQASRIIRFHRRLRSGVPAPNHLVDEALRIGQWLGVRVPELLVVPDLGTPLLWCLGRPKLLLPATLVKSLDLERWRGILTHELAHLRRGDHWVSRLELVANLIWWWNPIYWLARGRLDAEAELACDAWVVWALPKDRLTYAEALFQICSTLSLAKPPAPALGVAGSGRFFERRLTMILHDHVPCRLSPLGLLVACLLALFALPSWSAARPVADDPNAATATASLAPTVDPVATASIVVDDDDADDDDDDDDDDADDARAKAKAKAKADARKAKADAKKAQADAKAKAKAGAKAKAKADVKAKIDEEIESKFGPDFEKKMEELGEKIEKEIESKFGPDFEKKMESLGKEIESKFGPEFEKKMEALGKEMEARFGPGSDFEKSMKDLGKELEAKLGPGSDFEKSMKDLGKELEAKLGPGSDFAKKIAESVNKKVDAELKRAEDRVEEAKRLRGKGYAAESAVAAEESKLKGLKNARSALEQAKGKKESAKEPAAAKERRRERRIAALEAQIAKLAEELKALKAEDDQD